MSVSRDRPKYKQPHGMKYPRLSFDEFVEFESEFIFERLPHLSSDPQPCSAVEAAKSMRVTPSERLEPCCYFTSLANNDNFYNSFKIPKDVENCDLYSCVWPKNDPGINYLKERSKLFYGFHENYRSVAYSPYAGMAEWIHVRYGELRVIVLMPEDIKAVILSFPDLEFSPEPISRDEGEYYQYILKAGSFLTIPPGALTMRCALKDSYCFAGEYIRKDRLNTHLICFQRDEEESRLRLQVARKIRYSTPKQIESLLVFAAERDRDIRNAFLQLKTKTDPGESGRKEIRLSLGGTSQIAVLNSYIREWKRKHLVCPTPGYISEHTISNVAASEETAQQRRGKRKRKGMRKFEDEPIEPLPRLKTKRRSSKIKTFDNTKDPIDVLMDQTPSDNQAQ